VTDFEPNDEGPTPGEVGLFSLHYSYLMGIRDPFPGVMGQEHEGKHSPSSNAEINHLWSFLVSVCVCRARCLGTGT
jgi:hypothetical protein